MRLISIALSAHLSRLGQRQVSTRQTRQLLGLSAYILAVVTLLFSSGSGDAQPINSNSLYNFRYVSQPLLVTRKIVNIGFAGPLSGDSAGVGKSMAHAVEMALAEANRRDPHVNGIPVEFRLLAVDDQGSERFAPLVAEYLVKAGVIAVVGHWHSTASVRAAPVYNAANIPQISPGSSSTELTASGFDNVFRVIGSDDDISRHLVQFVQQNLRAKRIAVINDDTIYGTTLAKLFIQELKLKQGILIGRHVISSKTSDFNAAMADLKGKKPDAIFFAGLMAQAAVVQDRLKRANIPASLIAAGGIVSPLYLRLASATAEGAFGIATGVPQQRMNGWTNFHKKFVATSSEQIDYYAPFAYDAANLVFEAIIKANSLAPAKLSQALHSLKYKGLTGSISFDKQGNLNNAAYTVFRVQDGKWVPIQTYGGK